ncbi:MAG: hypothetical protein C0471_09320 [Erythrobacter sp.]|nr:hypothetical protein [Erythrobacter sp.]
MSAAVSIAQRRGGPLVMLALVLTAWTGARAVLWESPFVPLVEDFALPIAARDPLAPAWSAQAQDEARNPGIAPGPTGVPTRAAQWPAIVAAAPHRAWQEAPRARLFEDPALSGFSIASGVSQNPPPFLPRPQPAPINPGNPTRWSIDAWAFWRQGSNAAPVSQGRVPIYGASQVGAVLQYRLAAQTRRDPRLYMRAYRALVPRGESELALGASIRPMVRLPLRMAGEMRYTDAAFTNELRPSAYMVTEIPPIRLPYGAQMEAYGQAGWVGGASATAFADGQASLTRDVPAVARATGDDLRLSFGAAAWGGAQEDAQRLDVGPTLRLDLTVGEVPARISIDWRERVAGQAGPDSGVAATLSARF